MNPHVPKDTGTLSLRVCQFRHSDVTLYVSVKISLNRSIIVAGGHLRSTDSDQLVGTASGRVGVGFLGPEPIRRTRSSGPVLKIIL